MRLLRVMVCLALSSGFTLACGDEDEDGADESGGASGATNQAGAGGSRAGSSNGGSETAGKAGSASAGASFGGEAGGGGGGGTDPEPLGGAGGSGPEPIAGAGGSAGEGGAPAAPSPISRLSDEVYTQASDLRGLAFAEGGKLYASGHLGTGSDADKRVVVARFTAEGEPDEAFGEGGFVQLNLVERQLEDTTVLNDGSEESLGLAELENGDVIVQVNLRDANGKGTDVGLLRLSSSGEPVASFGENGLKRLVFGWDPATDDAAWTGANGPSDQAWGVELDDSGATQKIVIFGFGSAPRGATSGAPAVQRTDNDRYITRVLAETGEIDPTFNGGKVFVYNSGGTFSDGGRRGFVETDGSIVSAGYTNFGAGLGNHILGIRLQPDGTRDMAFGFGIVDKGVVRSNPFVDDGGVAECYNIARQSGGRYVTTGYGSATAANTASSYGYATTQGPDLISVAFTADGKKLDTSFGNAGTLVIQSEEMGLSSQEDRGRDVLALWDDRLVYAGRLGPNPALFVVPADGGYDPANGLGQVFTYDALVDPTPPPATPVATSHFFNVALSKDGTRIAATTNAHPGGALLAVLKVGDE